MAILSKSDILAAHDFATEEVFVPQWGGSVFVRTLSGRERDEFEASTVKMKNGKQEPDMANFRARFVALCVVDDNGQRLFKTRAEIDMLGSKSVAALQLLFNKAQELNSMTEDDVEELTSNFEEAPEEDSISG
jgi:hypothetical protein